MPESAINMIPTSQKWLTGCGVFTFWDKNGRLSYAVGAGDTSLPPERLRRCIVTNIIYGFGMRRGTMEFVDGANNYVQYLILGRVLNECDTQTVTQNAGQSPKDGILQCAVAKLRRRLSE
jgi:hypothetical protein